ncbi:AIM9 [[Candida] subhashii]|uniref:AIM9 n=1 Tax=[Candida] subhashii TaxID=561895 RepID=A0A8J5Q762_9ASCO|nr:AIM9 [[Candida] subhashii]KAG7662429.1 AIM9 [[Candida] subhashii]
MGSSSFFIRYPCKSPTATMLSRISRNALVSAKSTRNLTSTLLKSSTATKSIRFLATTSEKPTEVFTKLSDANDPNRSQFFQYTWGSWLKDDKLKKLQRVTFFSIEGISSIIEELNIARNAKENIDTSGEPLLKQPQQLKDGTYILSNNLGKDVIGSLGEGTSKLLIKSIASIHEGKHHRIYKITLSTGKELVLRIPYKLDSDYAISQKIKSEVATMDFLRLKLGLNVPKVLAYGDSKLNSLQAPFILEEFIDGELLMKKWVPLAPDSEETTSKLKSVIEPISEFQDKLLSITFNKSGSLYFRNDVDVKLQSELPYDGEENPLLKNRWRIGSSVERPFTKNKNKLSKSKVDQYNGPWDADKPLDVVTAVADIELENAKNRLSLVQADAGETSSEDLINKQIKTFEHLKQVGNQLFNPKSKSIMNAEELFKPRLYVPDLDPLNVIQTKDKGNYFIDFENTTIKPFILSSYPNFVAYHGAKIYNLEEDIPGYNQMDEVEKQQYQFMYFKTRNERLWELELNSKRHDLIAVASPHIKVLKSPYVQALELKNDKDYLYVEGSIVQLQAMWEAYVANELVDSTDTEFPIEFDQEYLDEFHKDLEQYQVETVSSPFAATGGWIPQDMFTTLKDQGIIVEGENGEYKIETEKVLEQTPEEKENEDKN